jgi:hypothetical protein
MDSNGRLMQDNDMPSEYAIFCIPGATINTITDCLMRHRFPPHYKNCVIAVGVNHLDDTPETIRTQLLGLEAAMLRHRSIEFGFMAVHTLPAMSQKERDNISYLNKLASEIYGKDQFLTPDGPIPKPKTTWDKVHYDQATSRMYLQCIQRWPALN